MRIFRKKQASVTALPSSGHDGDDLLLAQIAQHSDLTQGRHWVHYVYFANEDAARGAGARILNAGWEIQTIDRAAGDGPEWVVIAEKHGAVTDPDSVRAARVLFESIAAPYPGGEYDGWEASL